jgi:DNA primase
MSLEELLLNFILNNKNYLKRIDYNIFDNTKCKRIFKLLSVGLSESEILNTLSTQSDKQWFSEIIFNEIKYSDLDKAFMIILQDIKKNKIKSKMMFIMKKLSLMSDKNKDKKMLLEYINLLNMLKNPGKE